jgi:hypothetical protein
VNCVESRAAVQNGVSSLLTSKLILVVGSLEEVPSLGILQAGFNLRVNVVFFDCMSYFKKH